MPYDMLEVQLNLVIKMVRYVVVLVLLSGSMKDEDICGRLFLTCLL